MMTISTPSNASRPTARPRLALTWLTTALAVTLMSACGGQSNELTSADTSPTDLSAAQLQGRWQTAVGISPVRTALVLPGATAGSAELWLLANDLSSLSRLQVSTSGAASVSASGQTYSLPSRPSNPSQSVTFSGTANLSNNTLSLNAGALQLARSDNLASPSSLSAVAGNWQGGAGNQSATVNVSLSAVGTLGGLSSTGCSYTGALRARSDASVFDVNLTQTCPDGTLNFAGVASYRATPATLTLALTSTDAGQTQAFLVGLSRP